MGYESAEFSDRAGQRHGSHGHQTQVGAFGEHRILSRKPGLELRHSDIQANLAVEAQQAGDKRRRRPVFISLREGELKGFFTCGSRLGAAREQYHSRYGKTDQPPR